MTDAENDISENGVDFITFRDFVEEITGSKFEEIFNTFKSKGEDDE